MRLHLCHIVLLPVAFLGFGLFIALGEYAAWRARRES